MSIEEPRGRPTGHRLILIASITMVVIIVSFLLWGAFLEDWTAARLSSLSGAALALAGAVALALDIFLPVPSSLVGIPFDRPVVGYGGKTINTLRLWAAAAPEYFDFQRFSRPIQVNAHPLPPRIAERARAIVNSRCRRHHAP